jgi:type IV pilus assembly protein PilW
MTSHNQHPLFRRAAQAGFTLVEIMVGLAIGMLTTLIILQVFSVFETQKRTTTGSADAQTSGTIALFNMERELQGAGYPLQSAGYPVIPTVISPLKCTTLTVNGIAASSVAGLSPVVITDGGTGSDTLNLRYGDSAMGGIPSMIASMVGSTVTLDSNFGCKAGDKTLITNGTACAISSASAVTAASTVPSTVTLSNTTSAVAGAYLACVGQKWHEVIYKVNGENLEREDLSDASPAFVPVVPGIVNLQAQYGISATATSNTVTSWVDATGGTWAAPTVADRNRIKAIRVAVVARNAKIGSGVVTNPTCPTTGTATGLCAWEGSASSPAPTAILSGPDWQQYRYRVFDTIIPLRNVIWSKGML